MQETIFSYPCIVTLTFDLLTLKSIGSILDSWGDCMWFHEDRCKGEVVIRLKPFYLTTQTLHCDLDLWPFDPKVHRAHTWLMGRLHVKFHEDRCKGEAFMRLKPFYLTAHLQTDGQGDSSIPPNFVAGGIKKAAFTFFCLFCKHRTSSQN